MAEYRTEQKKLLLDFLKENGERAFSVEEAVAAMRVCLGDAAPGKSTVYRLVQHLVEEGAVKRFVRGNSRHFVYQLVQGKECHAHLHLKCTFCGKLLHLEEELSHELSEKIRHCNAFLVNEADSVLFGTCSECKRAHGSAEFV